MAEFVGAHEPVVDGADRLGRPGCPGFGELGLVQRFQGAEDRLEQRQDPVAASALRTLLDDLPADRDAGGLDAQRATGSRS